MDVRSEARLAVTVNITPTVGTLPSRFHQEQNLAVS
jgi:hypothetical protein